MHRNATPRKPSQGSSKTQACCTDSSCDSGLRNRYFQGKRLTADAFQVEQSYLLDRRRLLNRAIHGWGVVYGFGIKPATPKGHASGSGSLDIGAGLALDECGRELVRTRGSVINVSDLILFDEKGGRLETPPKGSYLPKGQDKPGDGREPDDTCWLLSVHYAEERVGPVKISDPCSCERNEWEHICETVRFSLRRRVPCSKCCDPFDCELECGCGTGPCCKPPDPKRPGSDSSPSNPVRRGGCQCLCHYLSGLSGVERCDLKDVDDPCKRAAMDLHHGVALACVRLREGDCDDWLFDESVEACGPRRMVKRNDLLFDLIRGCDLTRISAIGWAEFHRNRTKDPIGWTEFKDSFAGEDLPENRIKLSGKYWVEFSRPVRKDTVRPECFSLTVISPESREGWGLLQRAPIIDVDTTDAPGQPGLVTRATLIVDAAWVKDAILSEKRIFNKNDTAVEIEVRGDYIIDCNGQAVDANPVGLSPPPTGNGTPGGTFLSSFRVGSQGG